jgi:heparan-alpha-glucosaminide N-acetyltransferase
MGHKERTHPQAAVSEKTDPGQRLAALDAFRGFDILVMVFVNCIAAMHAIPFVLRHARAEMDTYTITDLVFPGFLFIVGVGIPLSLGKRTQAGDSLGRLLARIGVRTAGLIFLGLIEVNRESYSAANTGLGSALWYFLAYSAIIGLWNIYPKSDDPKRRRLYLGLRILAAAVLILLVILFRGQTEAGEAVWIQTSWWGILGQIGWAYLVCSLLYLVFGRSRAALMGILGLLIAFNAGAHLGALDFLGAAGPHDLRAMVSCHSAIVLAGLLIGTLFAPRARPSTARQKALFMFLFGAGLYAAGLLLRPIQGISKIRATESFALTSAGVCALAFLVFYLVMDILKVRRWASFLRPVGANPLLAYFLPDFVASTLLLLSSFVGSDLERWLWPFAEKGGLPGMMNGLLYTGLILLITALATRRKIILRL